MHRLTEEGQRIVADVAQRHGVSNDAVVTLLTALASGNGTQAQFNHPDLGGMGQWSQGGMIMVGDMFNQGLKYRVDALCTELAALLRGTDPFVRAAPPSQSQSQSGGASLLVPGNGGNRWPQDLGSPSSSGSQNDLHYAVFPATRRLAIERAGRITVYDTADHHITGFSQQQSGDQSLTFTSQYGVVRVADLQMVPAEGNDQRRDKQASVEERPAAQPSAPMQPAPAPPPQPAGTHGDVIATIERLAELHKKDILTAEEFAAKKAELLARL